MSPSRHCVVRSQQEKVEYFRKFTANSKHFVRADANIGPYEALKTNESAFTARGAFATTTTKTEV